MGNRRLQLPFPLCVLLIAIAVADSGVAQDDGEFYSDRSITVLVGSGVGGTTDTSARLIARHLRTHLPGNPSVIVQNMPGGGSVTMANHVYRSAPRDGTVLGYSLPGIVTAQLMEPDRARYDARRFNWIGSALKYTGVVSVLASAPATTIEQAKHTPLFIGTTGRGSPAHQFPAMAQAILGLQFDMITGYESSSEVVLAMERGEVHGQSSSLKYWAISRPNWLDEGRLVHLLYVGPRSPLAVPDIPYLSDLTTTERERTLVNFIEIGSNLGWPLFAPPEVPEARIEALRTAFSQLMTDPEFEEAVENTLKAQVDPSVGDELTAFVDQALETPAETVSEVKAILGLDR